MEKTLEMDYRRFSDLIAIILVITGLILIDNNISWGFIFAMVGGLTYILRFKRLNKTGGTP